MYVNKQQGRVRFFLQKVVSTHFWSHKIQYKLDLVFTKENLH